MNRPVKSLLLSILILALLAVPMASAEEKAVTPTEHPFLWVLPTEPPAFLFGTIHLPDDRVLALPEVVTTAFEASDVVCTEIPMDINTQTKAAMAFMLPGDKTLADILPEDLYERTDKYFQSKGFSIAIFQKFKVYAVALQLALLDYLSDFATKQPLDALLYTRAGKQGKETDALETVEEQIDIFESFSDEEQIELLRETLDQLEKGGAEYAEKMIVAYIAGDGERLWKMMYEYMDPDNAVDQKFMRIAITERNQHMAERIAQRLKDNEDKIYFFAVGAAHYDREDGILALLDEMGYKAKRINAADTEQLEEILSTGSAVGD
jgi:uncharacterized protein YbaP (TraB family)